MASKNTVILSDENGDYTWPVHVEKVKRYVKSEYYGLDEFQDRIQKVNVKKLHGIATKVKK